MTADKKPAAEHDVDTELVRRLLAQQHADLAHLPLRELASGWDNVIYRLGDAYSVRLPRRQLGADLVAHEQRWLPQLATRLPLPVPVPVRTGEPGLGYPWHWSICAFFEGEPAATSDLRDPLRAADELGAFLAALHQPAPHDAPVNAWRGCPLRDRHAVFEQRVEQLGTSIDRSAVRTLWEHCLALPRAHEAPVWLHGDLHTANILVHEGVLAAVIDFGDLTSGDPATDLAIGWMLFEPEARARFRRAAGGRDAAIWGRARGWALHLALALLANSADTPLLRGIGERTLREVLTDSAAD